MSRISFHVRPRALVLLYHRVSDPARDPQLLSVTPRNFAEHLRILRDTCVPLRLEQLGVLMRQRAVPHAGAVVTFDDGYADNLHAAKPLLQRHGVPATVFVSSGATGKAAPFWWDEVAELLLGREDLPRSLRVILGGEICEWRLEDPVARAGGEVGRGMWSVLDPRDPVPAYGVYRELCDRVRPLDPPARDAVLRQIREQVGGCGRAGDSNRALSRDEIRQLTAGDGVSVGAHTVNHLHLASMPEDLQSREIIGGKKELEEVLGTTVSHFSYPFGGRWDYTPATVDLVKRAGFSLACSNFEGVVTHRTDPFQIPRFLVRNWDGPTFADRLRDWLANPRPC